mmetsp:Transcript_5679/g.6975  ORF Transcript_5679/g.6975 Transcript_5679/m.6975 type:complete len:109 (-) Transcript_5679:377-703(-)
MSAKIIDDEKLPKLVGTATVLNVCCNDAFKALQGESSKDGSFKFTTEPTFDEFKAMRTCTINSMKEMKVKCTDLYDSTVECKGSLKECGKISEKLLECAKENKIGELA